MCTDSTRFPTYLLKHVDVNSAVDRNIMYFISSPVSSKFLTTP